MYLLACRGFSLTNVDRKSRTLFFYETLLSADVSVKLMGAQVLRLSSCEIIAGREHHERISISQDSQFGPMQPMVKMSLLLSTY